MTHQRKSKELPFSIESVRKKILRLVQKVETEAREFLQKYSGRLDTHKKWADGVQKACDQVGKAPADLQDVGDLEAILLKVRVNKDFPLGEYNELRRMLDRAKLFDHIVYELRGDLTDVYENQVEKFCLSFYQETKRQDLQSVTDYEMVIADCRKQITESFAKVEKDLTKVEDHRRTSLTKYVENYETVLDKMESICRRMGDVCFEIRKWVAADAEYVRNVQEEINSENRRLMDLRDIVKDMEEGRDSDGLRLRKTAGSLAKVEKQLKSIREEIGYYKKRKRNIEDNRSNLEADLARRQDEHQAVLDKLSYRQVNTPSTNAQLSAFSEALRAEMHGMEERLRQMDTQMESLCLEEGRARRAMEKAWEEVENNRKRHHWAFERKDRNEDTLKTINENIENSEAKIAALKKIREVKLHSDTLKKIHNYGYKPEHVLEIKDELQEAFRLTSEDIGKDWVNLYQRLPFDPPRDFRQRQRDLEVIDISHRRLDVGFKLLALKSLEKWRRLSNMASVEELISTLRKMRRDPTAWKIRHVTTPRSTARSD